MKSDHRIGSWVFGIIVGLIVATWSYQWVTSPQERTERKDQETAVLAARNLLAERLAISNPQIVDALAPNRKVGKVYIYPAADGWDVSGYYRRDDNDRWHAYLMTVTPDFQLASLKVKDKDPALLRQATSDALLDVTP